MCFSCIHFSFAQIAKTASYVCSEKNDQLALTNVMLPEIEVPVLNKVIGIYAIVSMLQVQKIENFNETALFATPK